MAISRELKYVGIDVLRLDPQNPRISRDKRKRGLTQDELLKEMSSWTLDELVDSFAQSGGFWTQDALIVVAERDGDKETGNYIVVEGNRRLAALKLLFGAIGGTLAPPRWLAERLDGYHPALTDGIFTQLPILVADSRDDVLAYLGFRHVTGIKEWRPAEKAEFIVSLVDEKSMTYREVAKQIGSRTDTVRQNYVAFKMLLQMQETEGFDWGEVEDRFSILFLSLRSEGTRRFLGVELTGDAPKATPPIPESKKADAKDYATWLFGGDGKPAVVKESRSVDKFGEILATPRAVEYLRSGPVVEFETAYSLTASADLVIDPLNEAARQIRLALSELPARSEEPRVQEVAWSVIEGGVALALGTGERNLGRAREALGAA